MIPTYPPNLREHYDCSISGTDRSEIYPPFVEVVNLWNWCIQHCYPVSSIPSRCSQFTGGWPHRHFTTDHEWELHNTILTRASLSGEPLHGTFLHPTRTGNATHSAPLVLRDTDPKAMSSCFCGQVTQEMPFFPSHCYLKPSERSDGAEH